MSRGSQLNQHGTHNRSSKQVDDPARDTRPALLLGVNHEGAARDVLGAAATQREVRGGAGHQGEAEVGAGQEAAQVVVLLLRVRVVVSERVRAAVPGAAALVDVEGVPAGCEAGQLALQLHAAARAVDQDAARHAHSANHGAGHHLHFTNSVRVSIARHRSRGLFSGGFVQHLHHR